MSVTIGGIPTTQLPDLGGVTDDTKFITDHAGTGSILAPALKAYVGAVGQYAAPFAGAASRAVIAKLADTISVRDFGAMGDGVADDTAACQAAINWALGHGGSVEFPAGIYKISGSGLTINQSLATYGLGRCNIHGSGKGNTQILYTGTGTCLSYTGNIVSAGIIGLLTIADLQIVGPGPAVAACGLSINIAAIFAMRDVWIMQFANGMNMIDTLSAEFSACGFEFNTTGFTAGLGVFSPPNALTFNSCILGNNSLNGGVVSHAAAFTWVGGSIESNGSVAGGNGIEFITAGDDGAVGFTFLGVYFENNANTADINIQHGAPSGTGCTYNVIGCMFNRDSVTNCVTNDILLASNAGNGPAILNVTGCGFRGFAPYTPSAARPYIAVAKGGATNVSITAFGNLYMAATERPVFSGSVVTQDAVATAWIRFDGASVGSGPIAPDGAFNATVSKTSTGIYVVTYGQAMAAAKNCPSIGIIGAVGVAVVTAETASTLTVQTQNLAGTLTDFQVAVKVHGGSPF